MMTHSIVTNISSFPALNIKITGWMEQSHTGCRHLRLQRYETERILFMKIKIKRLYEDAKLPTRGSEKAAGYDLYAYIPEYIGCEQELPFEEKKVRIEPHTTQKIGTGLAMEIPDGYFGAIFARSGLATKQGLRPANAVGVCDSDYRGEYIVAIHNDSDEARYIENGERIAQLVVMPYLPVEFHEVNELSDTQRGEDGFGSTGTK